MPFLASPHFNARPQTPIDLIVLHAISLPDGEFEHQHITDFFLGKLDTTKQPSFEDLKDVRVSAHFVVARDGSITQFVSTYQRAWHAGKSSWQGRDNCNDYSIGIEIIGDERQPFTHQQYTETARLCRSLIDQYASLDKQRIVGHQDSAPTRKWDPGKQWHWSHFHRSLAHIKHLHTDITKT
ncbi:MAG: 1,6-anhydro-N-acetylmuramyl-L-alanine amidase AmpD [Ghiorsea sp.]|nr:1,6-anhydro-N-acetylmuramyl-L-alanine amidase AmpD [Ghiorsea sp.]